LCFRCARRLVYFERQPQSVGQQALPKDRGESAAPCDRRLRTRLPSVARAREVSRTPSTTLPMPIRPRGVDGSCGLGGTTLIAHFECIRILYGHRGRDHDSTAPDDATGISRGAQESMSRWLHAVYAPVAHPERRSSTLNLLVECLPKTRALRASRDYGLEGDGSPHRPPPSS
jgi:hypothetical protein